MVSDGKRFRKEIWQLSRPLRLLMGGWRLAAVEGERLKVRSSEKESWREEAEAGQGRGSLLRLRSLRPSWPAVPASKPGS